VESRIYICVENWVKHSHNSVNSHMGKPTVGGGPAAFSPAPKKGRAMNSWLTFPQDGWAEGERVTRCHELRLRPTW
jgi:hypothetical protein